MKYAHDTKVSVATSRAEIEQILIRYGADQFASGMDNDKHRAMIQFRVKKLLVCFELPLPDRRDPAFVTYKRGSSTWTRSDSEQQRLYDQACRQRWRALALCLKAKLEAVECGIATFEEEFLGHIILPNGKTVGEQTIPLVQAMVESGRMDSVKLLGFEHHAD